MAGIFHVVKESARRGEGPLPKGIGIFEAKNRRILWLLRDVKFLGIPAGLLQPC